MPHHLRPASIASGFLTFSFFRGGVVSPTSNPQLEDQVSEFISPETGWPSYTLGHWIARVPRDRHFPYPLTWAPEETT
jgi:hypothetical protein